MWESAIQYMPTAWMTPLRRTAYALWGSVAFVALTFTLRGLQGAFRQELSNLAACIGLFAGAIVSTLAFCCYRCTVRGQLTRQEILLVFSATIGPPILLGIVLNPASSSWGLAWTTLMGIGMTIGLQLVTNPLREAETVQEFASQTESHPGDAGTNFSEQPHLSQWMTRQTLEEAGEVWEHLQGKTTVDFSAGQQHATVHISICPPLASTPEIECEVPTDCNVEWKVAAVHPYGVRLEVRRRVSGDELSVPLSYSMAAACNTLAKAA